MNNNTAAKIEDNNKPVSPVSSSGSVSLAFQKDGYDIYKCEETGLHFVYPQPTHEELVKVYSEAYFERGAKYAETRAESKAAPQAANDEKKLNLLKKYNVTSGKLLDVGCARGGFMKLAKEQGYEVEGVEFSAEAAEFARNEYELNVHTNDLIGAELNSNFYDLLCMWDVIEHLSALDDTIAETARVLKPGGHFFVTTGDIGSRYAKTTGRFWHLLTPPQHLFYFTTESMKRVLEKHGLEVQEIIHPGKHATIDFILFKAREAFGPIITPFQKFAQLTGLGKIKIYLNLCDIMTCVARKK